MRGVRTSAFDVQKEEPILTPPGPVSDHRRLIDRLSPATANTLTVLGFGLPVVWYFWFVDHYSLNAVVGDQWSDVNVIRQSYANLFDWTLYGLNILRTEFFSPTLSWRPWPTLCSSTFGWNRRCSVVGRRDSAPHVVHKQRYLRTPWLYYCPIAILILSIVQYGNTIWGFQLAWYMVMLSLAATLLLLDRIALTWPTLVGALAVAIVGSFSSLQGLLIWPAGLVLLYYRRRSLPRVGVWIVSAIFAYVLYFHNYDDSQALYPQYASEHLFASLKFFLFAIGGVVGKPVGLGTSNPDNVLVILFGLLIVLLALGTVLLCGVRRDERSGSPLGVALICYGLLFAALITQGRSFLGLGAASFSRYTTFDILILVGIYLALLDRHTYAVTRSGVNSGLDEEGAAPTASADSQPRSGRRWTDRVRLRVLERCCWLLS